MPFFFKDYFQVITGKAYTLAFIVYTEHAQSVHITSNISDFLNYILILKESTANQIIINLIGAGFIMYSSK